MSSCIQEAFLLKDLSSSLSLYLSFCVSLSSSWSPPDEPWCSPRSDDVWYVSGSVQIAEMWLFIDDRLTDWRRRRRRKATVRSAPDGSDNKAWQKLFWCKKFKWNTPQYELCEKQKTSFVGEHPCNKKSKEFQLELDETLTDASALCCQKNK